MKKILKQAAATVAAALTLAACQTQTDAPQPEQPVIEWENMKIEVTAAHPDAGAAGTRALKEGWAHDDRIVAFFNHNVEHYIVIQYDWPTDSWSMVSWGDWPGSFTGSVQAMHAGSGDMLNVMYYNDPVQIQAVHGDLHFAEDGTYIVNAQDGSIRVTLDMQRSLSSAIKVEGTGDNGKWRLAGPGLAVHNGMNMPEVSALTDGDGNISFRLMTELMFAPSQIGGLVAEPDDMFSHPAVFHVVNTDQGAATTTFQMYNVDEPEKLYTRTYERPLLHGATVVIQGPESADEAERAQWQMTLIPIPRNQFEQDGVYYRRITPDHPEDLAVGVVDRVYGDLMQNGQNTYSGRVEIPAEVTHAGVTYPVVAISQSAFNYCDELTEVVLHEGLETIMDGAFFGCESLTSVNIPASVTSIAYSTFHGCSSLAISFDDDQGLYHSDGRGGLMSGTTLLWVSPTADGIYNVPEGTQTVYSMALDYCTFTRVIIPASVTDMTGYMFTGCYDLRDVELQWSADQLAGVNTDSNYYFFNQVNINNIVIRVPEGSFDAYVTHPVWGTMPNIVEPTGAKFSKMDFITGKELYYIWKQSPLNPDRKDAAVKRPEPVYGLPYRGRIEIPGSVWFDGVEYNVTRIAPEAFAGSPNLTEVVLPAGITEIGLKAFVNCPALTSLNVPASMRVVFSGAFEGCSSLSITVDGSNTRFAAGPNGELTDKAGTQLLWVPENLAAETYAVPDGTTTIVRSAILNNRVSKLTIPASVTKVENDNFRNCLDLTVITLGWTAEQLAATVFSSNVSDYFSGVDKSAITLNVPTGTGDAYRAHPLWGGFTDIVEM